MHISTILRVLGVLLFVFSTTMLPPIWVDWIYQEQTAQPFWIAFAFIIGLATLLWFPNRTAHRELKVRDGFIVVVLFWSVLCVVGAFPFIIAVNPDLSITDSIFEAISGITTTGATVISNIDALPHSILYYRQQLQLLGGLGILILAVAILPMLGVGGMQLFRAESTGPVKDQKLTPRITQSAKALWVIYLVLTLAAISAFTLAGMPLFEAVCYGFSTMATGGFAPHDASMGYFHQPIMLFIAMAFMLLSAVSFPLHFLVLHRRKLSLYWQDAELKYFVFMLLFAIAVTFGILRALNDPHSYFDALFHVVSFATTTGLITGDYVHLPAFLPLFLLFLGVVGGCAGSTTGGMKVIRFTLLQKQGMREIKRLIHPNGTFMIRFGERPVSNTIIEGIWGFLAVYVGLFVLFFLLVSGFESDMATAYTTVIATFSNIGPALGEAALHYGNLSDPTKWVLSLAMLCGRLEMLTVLVFFSPEFWKK